jgi:hypothetical protein
MQEQALQEDIDQRIMETNDTINLRFSWEGFPPPLVSEKIHQGIEYSRNLTLRIWRGCIIRNQE